jgi:hypothetical protein
MTRRGRIASVAATAIAAVAVAAPAGLAATPQKINSDLADGRLDGTYSQKDLSNYLKSATAQGYGGPVQQASPPSGVLGGGATLAADRGARGGTLAFTGLDLALLTFGGLLLLALGAVLRWASRERAPQKS